MIQMAFCIVTALFLDIGQSAMAAAPEELYKEKPVVFVSIAPYAYFVERIGGEHFETEIMVGAGHNHHTYEPSPRQMAALARAKIYFRSGLPFEDIWLLRLRRNYPHVQFVDLLQGVELRAMDAHCADESHDHHHHDHEGDDPHVWLSPTIMQIQSKTICDALCRVDPQNAETYRANLKSLLEDLQKLHLEIEETLSDVSSRKFMVYHPAWGYFADAYDLEQIAIEAGGKEPSARQLAATIQVARQEDIRAIFVQEQFSRRSAEAIARAIDGTVLSIDPLEKDYINNLRRVAITLAEALQ